MCSVLCSVVVIKVSRLHNCCVYILSIKIESCVSLIGYNRLQITVTGTCQYSSSMRSHSKSTLRFFLGQGVLSEHHI